MFNTDFIILSFLLCVICHPEAPTSHTGEPSSPDAQSQELCGLLSYFLHLILLRHSCSCYSCWNSQVSIWIQKTGYDTVNAVGLNISSFPLIYVSLSSSCSSRRDEDGRRDTASLWSFLYSSLHWLWQTLLGIAVRVRQNHCQGKMQYCIIFLNYFLFHAVFGLLCSL